MKKCLKILLLAVSMIVICIVIDIICEKNIEVVGNGKVIEIVDKTQKIRDFVCAEALEGFFEDENYEYFFGCIKGKYIIVKYENGHEETVEKALKRGTITVEDLDVYGIGYIKYEKNKR